MKRIIIHVIRAYQVVSRSLSSGPFLLGGFSGCRALPTCSEYAMDMIDREGVFRGGAKAIGRVARCNPLWPAQHHG